MNNPLRIFSNTQIDALNQKNLNQLKKEILLEFQLSSNPTIRLNNEEIDKNGVLEIFKELEHKLPLHLFIRQNKTLNTFLYIGNIAILNDDVTIQKIKNLNGYKDDVEQKIVANLKPIIAKLVMKPSSGSGELTLIKNFIQNLNPALFDEAYSNAYEELKNHLDYLEETYKTPFSGSKNTNFHFDLGKHVNFNFYRNLEPLPNVFNSLTRRYCRWCNDNILFEALQKEKKLHKYSRESLHILRDAAKIASNINNKEGNLKIANSIQSYLEQGLSPSSSKETSVWTILVVIFILIRLVLFFNKSSKRSDNSFDIRQNSNRNYSREYASKIIKEAQKSNDILIKNKNEQLAQDFSGDKTYAVNPILINQKDHKSFTELTFKVDVFPSRHIYFYKLIPPDLAEKHKNKIWPVVMTFRHLDLKGSKLKHRLKYDFNSKSTVYPQDYSFKKSVYDEDLNLSINSIPYENYPLNGVLSRNDPATGKELYSTRFTIEYVSNSREFIVITKPSKRTIIFSEEYIDKLHIKKPIEEKDKYAIAIKNMNLMNNIYLKQGSIYTLKDIFYYSIENSLDQDFPNKQILKEDAFLRYYITSQEDNTSYIELKSDHVNLKYYADYNTGIIKGMTMVSATWNTTEVERLILFRS